MRPSLSRLFTKRTAAILALSAAAIAATIFLLLPAVIRPVLEKKISETVNRRVVIHKVYFNPFALEFALRGMTVSQRDSSDIMLSFDELSVNVQAKSVFKGGLIIDSVRLVKPYVNIVRNRDLTYNFSDLTGPGSTPPKAEEQQKPFRFWIDNIEVVDGSADFHDTPKNITHTVRDLYLSVPFLSNFPDHNASYVEPSLKATVNGTTIMLKGKTLPFDESLETTMDIDLENIGLQHYLEYSPVLPQFKLVSGGLDVRARVSFKQFKKGPPTVSVTGTIALKDVRLVDRNEKPLVELPSFSMKISSSDLLAKTAYISDIRFKSPKIYVERDSDGELNILKAFVPVKPNSGKTRDAAVTEEVSKAKSDPVPDIRIDKVTLNNGSIYFRDAFIQPTFKTSLLDIGGTVSGLSSRLVSPVDFALRGSINGHAPLAIKGNINPQGKELVVDIAADLKNMEMNPLTPYSGTYIGNAIEKGKLSFSIHYRIAQKKLEARNSIFLDQLTLGERVNSAKATELPVGLAVSLLKDRKGEIRLDIPVSGATDDPDFNVWNVFLHEMEGLIVKTAASPFALLGSMTGGEELGYIEFDYGAVEMNTQGREKLDTLVNALSERPSLKLEIAGYVDPERDGEALKMKRMNGLAADRTSESVRIHDDDLWQLASQRARTTRDAIIRSQKIDPERVFLIKPRSFLPEQKDKLKSSRVDFTLK